MRTEAILLIGRNCFEMWCPGTELNRRRQPFQNRGFEYFQRFTSRRSLPLVRRVIIYLTRPVNSAIFWFMENVMSPEPKSLQEAILYFSNPDNCIDYLAIRRWPDGRVICPGCGSDRV